MKSQQAKPKFLRLPRSTRMHGCRVGYEVYVRGYLVGTVAQWLPDCGPRSGGWFYRTADEKVEGTWPTRAAAVVSLHVYAQSTNLFERALEDTKHEDTQ